jgi:HD-GYP domain-containing protein (c-di-GMP phosphodiesterase class II)/DNA-binding CsgD family transcriptional regulator
LEGSGVRVAELVCAISLATDLGTGQPMEHALRTCVLAQFAGEALDLEPAERRELYFVSLLRSLGCTSGAAEDAAFSGGSELDFYARFAPVLMGGSTAMAAWLVRHLGEGQPALRRARLVLAALRDTDGLDRSLAEHCEAGQRLGRRMGMEEGVIRALGLVFERFDGKGYPNRIAGYEIPISVRINVVARDVELLDRLGGWTLVRDTLARRAGRAYDPHVVRAFLDSGQQWIAETRSRPAWESTLEAEPSPRSTVLASRTDEVLASFADFVDLKSPYLFGHSSGVAQIAADAGAALGLDDEACQRIRRAALVHDLGRVSVSNAVWDRRGPLGAADWERVRLHPYYTERILVRSSLWAGLTLASSHHERLDGSGYQRGATASQLSAEERLLAAADSYQAMTQQRPHRPALSAPQAIRELSAEAENGRLDPRAVRAIADVAGHPRRGLEPWPAGLTDREVEVLRLIAMGKSNREVAAELVITPKTVGHHVEHIYAKIGVRTRAGAALFLMEQGLAE